MFGVLKELLWGEESWGELKPWSEADGGVLEELIWSLITWLFFSVSPNYENL